MIAGQAPAPEKGTIYEWETSASGYAAVWATENTREALFDAMERRETYATTGSRMIVRLFGGFDFDEADAMTRSPATIGYSKGVPMGGDLGAAPAGKTPTFLVAALKDPIGANLDRYQVIKGWIDANGDMQEKVYDVAWSGGRKPGADDKLPPVGSTVDVASATSTNTIGAPELIAVWEDPDFDPNQSSAHSTTDAFSRSPHRVGRPTTPSIMGSSSLPRCRRPSRSAPTRRPYGIRLSSKEADARPSSPPRSRHSAQPADAASQVAR